MMTDSHDSSERGLEHAAQRLDKALTRLESRFETMLESGAGAERQAPDAELADAAANASQVLAQAIEDVKDAILEAEQAESDGQG